MRTQVTRLTHVAYAVPTTGDVTGGAARIRLGIAIGGPLVAAIDPLFINHAISTARRFAIGATRARAQVVVACAVVTFFGSHDDAVTAKRHLAVRTTRRLRGVGVARSLVAFF